VRDRAVVGPQADLLPLDALVETYESLCTTVVDYEKARLFVTELGRIEEESNVWDEVPGRHEQGGWAQMRFQRHVDDHRQKHLKHVAEVLFRLLKRRRFDHLILAGSDEAVADLERELHDYLRQRVRARIHLPIIASAEEVLTRSLAVEEELERNRERAKVEQLAQAAAAGTRGVAGLPGTLAALAEARVGELIVGIDRTAPGMSCPSCGRLSEGRETCPACGNGLLPVPDVIEAAVAQALRQGCLIETVMDEGALAGLGGIGALLRF
jgi:peptide chain release factor subunit 1